MPSTRTTNPDAAAAALAEAAACIVEALAISCALLDAEPKHVGALAYLLRERLEMANASIQEIA